MTNSSVTDYVRDPKERVKPALSIITATYNAEKYLPNLIESLRLQDSRNFEWVVADGASTDSTLAILNQVEDLNIVITSQKDFGIYDALNRAINMCSGGYYLVVGSDDELQTNAVSVINEHLNSNPGLDLLIGEVVNNNKIIRIRKGLRFLYGARALVASHSVGCVFNKKLHDKHGMYSNKYPILADTYFIKQIFADGGLRYIYAPEIFGNFSGYGVSSNNILRSQCEFAHIQLTTEKYKYVQLIIIVLRLLRNLFNGEK